MDNPTHNSQNDWVDARLASLAPSKDWHPDSKRALAQLLKRRDGPKAERSFRWVRLSMAAAVLASIGLVVALLPWQTFWEGTKVARNLPTDPSKTSTSVVESAPAPASPAQSRKTEEHSGQQVIAPQFIGPEVEPDSSDEARRAHIQGTVLQTPVERVGPGVTPPKLISSVEPNYTDEARQAHIQGTVILSVTFRADGTAKVDKIVRGLGYGLDEKAIEAVEKWRFVPGMKDGNPVDVQLQVTVNFHLY